VESREETIKALEDGKKLTSSVTGIQYKLIDGQLHSKNVERSEWVLSGLTFLNPCSWTNLRD
jgi:hypothetical protein